jgi:toxin ParE1/3/4
MKLAFRLTPRAMQDLKAIGRYTLKAWGAEQRNLYLAGLDARFSWLAGNPKLGKTRAEVAPNYRSFIHSSHVIFYTEHKDAIHIIGILHQSMDVWAHPMPDL